MPRQSSGEVVDSQVAAGVAAIRSALRDNARAIYLYGSATSGGLKPHSDIDVFVVLDRPTTYAERAELVSALTPLSAKRARPADWRPLEVTGAVQSTLSPLSDPPVTDFQFGEWLRDGLDSGLTEPQDPNNPDLPLLVAMVRRTGQSLHGPSPEELIAEVTHERLQRALHAVIPGLLEDLDLDTANVLLTLARIAYTRATGSFASKGDAADWALPRVHARARPALERARDVYGGAVSDSWDAIEAAVRDSAEALQALFAAWTVPERVEGGRWLQSAGMSSRFRGGEIYGIPIPTVFDENTAIRCEGCGEPIAGTPFRISLLDIVAPEAPPSWAIGAKLNPGPHQFHADPEHFRAWARRRGLYFCRLSDVREIMRPVPIPGDKPRWGLCDGLHREAHELIPA